MPQLNSQKKLTGWSKERADLVRGASGGFLFGIPLVYTMELWGIGSYINPPIMLAVLSTTYIIVVLLNRTEGFRKTTRDTPLDAAMEGVEALAIGLFCSSLMLILLRRITLVTPLDEALGKIIFGGVPFAFGVALARLILNPEIDSELQSTLRQRQHQPFRHKTLTLNLKDTFADISATLIGATIIAFSIAPTDEVPALAAGASPPWLLAIMAASLIISYGIVFVAGFTNQEKRQRQQGLFQTPASETVISYLVSLLVSFLMLWFFQRLSLSDPWFLWLRYTLLLGLPATIGGAAGRIAV
jgi:putative integral membrane protein (TIGR02587 family)